MSGLLRRSVGSIWSSSGLLRPLASVGHQFNIDPSPSDRSLPLSLTASRTFFTSPVTFAKTRKRRKRHPFFWLQDQYHKYFNENLTAQNEEFFQQFLKDKYPLEKGKSPLKAEPWAIDETFTDGTVRTGVIAQKLGSFPMWSKEGQYELCTCLRVSDNHVIKYHSPDEYAKIGRPVDRKRYSGLGCIIVGSNSADPRQFTAEYNGLFNESGVMPKKKLSRFFISHKARIEPGTPLLASHFRPGMFVDLYGKSIEYGRKGVRFRFKVKLGTKTHGATKNLNRIGSIGRGRKECGPLKGKKMPGHEGGERVIAPGLKILRIDTKYNLIYVLGRNVPGLGGTYINVMDSRLEKKRPKEDRPPPFPTTSVEANSKLDQDLYDESVHVPSEPSIIMTVTEEEKKAAALLARSIGKAKTAQKLR